MATKIQDELILLGKFLSGIVAIVVAFWFFGMVLFSGSRRWFRFRKRIACVFGNHAPGTLEDAVGGRRIKRCLYCDKLVEEYRVIKDQLRRIY